MDPYADITHLEKAKLTPAREALTAAFLQLCRTKPFAAIGVTELCARAHVARSTFYASYPNTDALLTEIEDALIVDQLAVIRHLPCAGDVVQESQEYLCHVMDFVRSHETTLSVLLVDQPDSRLIEKWKRVVKHHFWALVNDRADPQDVELELELIASMSVGAYTHILRTKESPRSLERITRALISTLSSLRRTPPLT